MLPYTLYRFNTFIDGDSYLGETESVDLPKISRQMEKYRSGGMAGNVNIDLGQEDMESAINFGGVVRRALSKYGAATVDGVQLRWVGSFKSGSTAVPQAVECTMRGRFQEFEMGSQKAGSKTEKKSKFPVSYYKLVIDGETVFEIDMIAGVCVVDGVDIDAVHRAIIGG